MSLLQFGNRPKKFVFVHKTTFHCFCVRLTNNMMCNLAVELAMASTASTVQTKGMNIEIVLRSLLVALNLMVFMAE